MHLYAEIVKVARAFNSYLSPDRRILQMNLHVELFTCIHFQFMDFFMINICMRILGVYLYIFYNLVDFKNLYM